jgi:hypothetical protein
MIRIAVRSALAGLLVLAVTACERAEAHAISAPIGDVSDATLELASGADAITVRSEDLGDDLYVVSTPDDASVVPVVERDDDVVRIRLVDDDDADGADGDEPDRRVRPPWDDGPALGDRDTANGNGIDDRDAVVDDADDRDADDRDADDRDADDRDADDRADGQAAVEIRLSDRVRWTLRLAGGAKATTVDMGAGGLAAVEFGAGVSHIRLALPRPEGTVAVRMLAGSSEFDVTAPADVPIRVRIEAGAGSVILDGATQSGVAAGTVFTPPSWESSTDRYDIEAVGGVSRLTVARR